MKTKRILAALLSALMLSAVPTQLAALAQSEDIITLSPDVSGKKVAVTTDGNTPRSGIVIHAAYNTDGSLKSVETQEFENASAEASEEVTLDFTYKEGDKLFAWQSLDNMEPYEAVVKPEYLVTYAGVQDLGWSQFVVAQFEDGYNLENTTLTVDGTDVTAAFTPVTTDGSIVKWEITNLNPATLTVTNTEKGTQTITLSDNENPTAPTVKKDTTAGYMIAHGPMAIWDYYLTVYDKDGAIRVEPKETTINLTGTETTDAPAAYSPEAEITANGTGTVEIMFNYNKDWEKTWFDAIKNQSGSVELVTYDENKYVLNNHLTFTKTANVTHGSGKVGEIEISLGQDNFKTNGRYYIRVRSEGHDSALVPIHVVNETAPTLSVTAGSEIRSGENVTFKIGNMVYGITNPTYAAELTRPDGKTVEIEMITDWYQIGDNLYLYNTEDADGIDRNKIPYKGEYTLTVHSNGFKDMSAVFTVSQGEEIPVTANLAAYGIDIMSSATYSGSVSGDSSSGTVSGGQAVSADVKFNADLLINAMIIAEQMGIENDAAKAICDRWNSMTPDSVSAANTTLGGFDWNEYYSAVSNARHEGEYLSFADYANDNFDSEKTTVPHAVKSVLENNLLGDIQYDAAWVGKDCPFMALVKQNKDGEWEYTDKVMVGEDINIICYGTEYLSSLSSVNLNGNSSDLTKDTDYTLSISQDSEYMLLTIKKANQSLLNVNTTNTVTLKAPKYKTNTLYIPYEKEMEQNLSLETDKTTYTRGENGTDVVITVTNSEGDFLTYLDKIEVTTTDGDKKNALSASAGGTSTYYYEKTGDNTVKLTDSKNTLFADNGEYTIKLIPSQYYNALDTTVTINGELKPVPNDDPYIYSVDDDTYSVTVKHYLVDFGENNQGSGLDAWKSAIKSVKVNGTEYTAGTLERDKYTWPTQSGNDIVMELYGLTAFKDGKENTIVIKATGYDDLTLTFNSLEDRTAPTFKAKSLENGKYRITFDGTEADIDKYLKRLETVTVGGIRYYSSGISENSIYTLVKAEDSELYTALDLAPNAVNEFGTTAVSITAKGYTSLNFNIDNGERPIINPPSVDTESLKTKIDAVQYGDTDHYRVAFTGNTDEIDAYLTAVTAVTVGEVSYTDIANSFYSSLSSSLYRRTQESDVYKYLDIAANAIPDYETETEITVTATGYNDLKFTIDNTEKHMPSAPEQDKVTPKYGAKDYYSISFKGEAADIKQYLSKITSVVVGETEYTYASSFSSYTENKYKIGYVNSDAILLDLTDDAIAQDDVTTVKITATGYEDGTITIDPTKIVKDTPPTAIESVSESEASDYSPKYYSITFAEENEGDASEYLSRITDVKVGDTDYVAVSNFAYNSENAFTVSNGKLLITADAMNATGGTTVAITAKGYTDKSYTITIKDAPELNGKVTLVKDDGDVEYYRVSIQGTADEVNEYFGKVLSVTVGQNKYAFKTGDFAESDSLKYRLTTEGEETPKYVYLDFTTDGLAENDETTITIAAECYAPLTFTLGSADDRQEPLAITNHELKEASSSDYADYYRLTLDAESARVKTYLDAVTDVTVNGISYSKVSYDSTLYASNKRTWKIGYDGYYYSPTYKYIELTADEIPAYETKTEIVINATGYKPLKYEIDNSDKHPAAAPATAEYELVYGSTDYYKITFLDDDMDDSAISSYISNITGVTVGETDYSKASSFYYGNEYKLEYVYSSGYVYTAVDITDDAVSETGKTNVVIKSKGYADKTVEIDNTNRELDDAPTLDEAVFAEGSSSTYHDYYRVTFTGDADEISTYLGRITAVTVGSYDDYSSGTLYASYAHRYQINGTSYGSYSYIDISSDGVPAEGTTKVVLESKGYKPLEIELDGSEQAAARIIKIDSIEKIDAVEAQYWYQTSTPAYWRVTFTNSEKRIEDFLDNIASVTVGDKTFENASSFSDGDTLKWKKATDSSYGSTSTVGIDFTEDAFGTAETTVTIKATGYDDLIFKINAEGALVTE